MVANISLVSTTHQLPMISNVSFLKPTNKDKQSVPNIRLRLCR